jgi:Putative virion core protein (lumpy skin disease virus)
MGLIKAITGAAGGVLADQWREFFYCESLPKDVLVVKGQKVITSRSSNTKGNDNIISNGSGIAVADGQAMIIVEQGKVVEYCEIPGEYTYDSSTEPSIFAGSFGQSILETFKVIGKRFTFGGDTAKDQRVYYFNTKEIPENLFGTSRPVPFRVVDKNIGLDIDVSVRCNGTYSYKIVNPLLFYTNVCGNVSAEYRRKEIDAQLKSEFVNALPPAFSRISAMQIRPNELGGHLPDVCDALNAELSAKWLELRGIKVVSVAFNAIDLPEEDLQMIKTAQRNAINRDPGMAAATLVGAQAEAMTKAAENKAGAMTGFMGMGMAQNAGGMNAQQLFELSAQQKAAQQAQQAAQQQNAPQQTQPQSGGWQCSCGATNTGNFCMNCGKPKPAPSGWNCSKCGATNTGNFCMNCGAPKSAPTPVYRCNKCGWQPDDPHNPPKFCPQCGDIFDGNDVQ